ncbi:MAG: ABC transporter ATP-binding protein [Candidatus Woesearchaeota archaeon]|nr:MAG: ABC transporter ATP-binding protein [Candidatus Woesearchaeota archaeon]
MVDILKLENFSVTIGDKKIVKNVNLTLKKGEITVIMGPNGSGKSTLASAIMGNPSFETEGKIILNDNNMTKDISELTPDERSKEGIFLSFQYPVEIPGVTVSNFLRAALNSRRQKNNQLKIIEFVKLLNEKMDLLHIPREFASRYLNEGFSGGEKKKMEILQLAMLNPKIAILDETDSGLDIDALRNVCESINIIRKDNPELTLLIITHYQRMLNYIKPDRVCIMVDGRITKCGGSELAEELERKGYTIHKG